MISLCMATAALGLTLYKHFTLEDVRASGRYAWISLILAWFVWYQINEVL